jgi:hypothetical protein
MKVRLHDPIESTFLSNVWLTVLYKHFGRLAPFLRIYNFVRRAPAPEHVLKAERDCLDWQSRSTLVLAQHLPGLDMRVKLVFAADIGPQGQEQRA